MKHCKKIGLASLSVLTAALLAACNVDEAGLQTLGKHEALTIVHTQGEEAQALYEKAADNAQINAEIIYFELEELQDVLVEKATDFDLVITDVECTPLWCREDNWRSSREIYELLERFENPFRCDPRVCDPPGPTDTLDLSVPVSWGYTGVFTSHGGVGPTPVPINDILRQAREGELLVGWCGGPPYPFPFPLPKPSPWSWPWAALIETLDTELAINEADLLFAHSSQLLGAVEQTDLSPLLTEGLEPRVDMTQAYLSAESNGEVAGAFLSALLQDEVQVTAFEEMGTLPVTERALAEVGEMGLVPFIDYALENHPVMSLR